MVVHRSKCFYLLSSYNIVGAKSRGTNSGQTKQNLFVPGRPQNQKMIRELWMWERVFTNRNMKWCAEPLTGPSFIFTYIWALSYQLAPLATKYTLEFSSSHPKLRSVQLRHQELAPGKILLNLAFQIGSTCLVQSFLQVVHRVFISITLRNGTRY